MTKNGHAREVRSLAANLRNRMIAAQKADAERIKQQEAEAAAEQTRIEGLCADAAKRLEAEGWTGVKVAHRAFYTISGDSPQGVNHSTANEDLDAALAHMLAVGKPVERRRSASAVAESPPKSAAALPEMSPDLRALFLPEETFAVGRKRLTKELAAEYDLMMQYVMSGEGKQVIDQQTGKTASERHAEISKLKHELAELGDVGE